MQQENRSVYWPKYGQFGNRSQSTEEQELLDQLQAQNWDTNHFCHAHREAHVSESIDDELKFRNACGKKAIWVDKAPKKRVGIEFHAKKKWDCIRHSLSGASSRTFNEFYSHLDKWHSVCGCAVVKLRRISRQTSMSEHAYMLRPTRHFVGNLIINIILLHRFSSFSRDVFSS